MSEPDFRFYCQVVDQDSGEVIIADFTHVSRIGPNGECESVDMIVSSMLRKFRNERNAERR